MDVLDLTEQLHELKRQRWELEDRYGVASYRVEGAGRPVADPVEHLRRNADATLVGVDRGGAAVCRVRRDGEEIVYEPADG